MSEKLDKYIHDFCNLDEDMQRDYEENFCNNIAYELKRTKLSPAYVEQGIINAYASEVTRELARRIADLASKIEVEEKDLKEIEINIAPH